MTQTPAQILKAALGGIAGVNQQHPSQTDRIWIINTREIVDELRYKLTRLSDCGYNLNEIGAILIDSTYGQELHGQEIGPEEYARQRDDFASHFSRHHMGTPGDAEQAHEIYDWFFDAIQGQIFRAKTEECAGTDFLSLTFHSWLGAGDLALIQHKVPY